MWLFYHLFATLYTSRLEGVGRQNIEGFHHLALGVQVRKALGLRSDKKSGKVGKKRKYVYITWFYIWHRGHILIGNSLFDDAGGTQRTVML